MRARALAPGVWARRPANAFGNENQLPLVSSTTSRISLEHAGGVRTEKKAAPGSAALFQVDEFYRYFRAAARSVPTGSIEAAADEFNPSVAFSLNPLAPVLASWSFT